MLKSELIERINKIRITAKRNTEKVVELGFSDRFVMNTLCLIEIEVALDKIATIMEYIVLKEKV